MTDDLTHFEDPPLKAAIRRVRGAHVARPELVDRVRQRLAAELAGADDRRHGGPAATDVVDDGADAIPIRPDGRRWRLVSRRVAFAASIVVAFGLGMLVQRVTHEAAERREYLEANRRLFREMIAAHTGADDATAGAQSLALDRGAAALRDEAAAKLSRFVPLPDLAADGWRLESAALRQIRASPAASFVFARGDGRKITLLSMPAELYAFARDGQTYETVVDGHPISGFIRGGGVHCVIGDASTPPADVTSASTLLRKRS